MPVIAPRTTTAPVTWNPAIEKATCSVRTVIEGSPPRPRGRRTGRGRGELMAARRQLGERLERLLDADVERAAVAAVDMAEDAQVLDDRQRREDRPSARELADTEAHPPVGRDVGYLGAEEVDRSP